MIRKYTFGNPIPTDAVVLEIPREPGTPPMFDCACAERD